MSQDEKRAPQPGERWRAPYATDPAASRGRLIPEPGSPTRSPFQRDRDRIIHSTAFRRLKHKTQVFVHHEGDHYRTRLTHTLEVSQIARALARALGLDEDLAEALALSHDLGHTCFGHTGEDALDACMADFGGFDHNAQALRIVTRLERRYAGFDGLNLAWETLEGLVKHNGPLLGPGAHGEDIPAAIREYDAINPLDLARYAGPEAQAAALADDIAYDSHDLDDGLRAGLFELADLAEVPFLAGLLNEIAALHPGLESSRVIHELARRVITRFVEDVIGESGRRLAALAPQSVEDIRGAAGPVVAFSPAMAAADADIKRFLFARMYRHPGVIDVRRRAARIVEDLFRAFRADPSRMPEEWRAGLEGASEPKVARRVADYIAGMTDTYAALAHRRLYAETPDLHWTPPSRGLPLAEP
ncbi:MULTISPECIES: deoxyguanosinetriphosphate triphosphohydrolase [Methylobacterium]|uniref:Deoxyguanosinetriphosphate triphosphohydrolase-like protein n=4 Tax=Pseudomonadota TaxID=1224 RepID=A0ABQ4SX46_9HYPH|nr:MULTISPECIES: deoxyguanosinetriphosphate triphosphohydrolase [Methylobacterium]PIU05743.1 MAG: deoxyguanosinetriphosphate triphosphohydrolase [Methylobacterium sp. CG09_land_8_20_14_0_10_71_15]PIU15284.1 MAG: deoxyguanosinetriphosphate triphosphohydrolase [Methylobacterium sp. CG08_land_8_20_14_0_20_71_15]GBU19942.1 deoxyguanosine triphosphate triphosphohydrolase [Methylobacterium sp.]GJE06515.1 Deoxyguanosinetriphosphate triphosphohydrolase-like protein [Methylobacterium jeotgali]